MGREQLDKDRRLAAEVITQYVKTHGVVEMDNAGIMKILADCNATPKDVMYQNPDLCYDWTNHANLNTFKDDIHIFSYVGRNRYKLLGIDYPFTGEVRRKPKGTDTIMTVGEWYAGKLISWNTKEWVDSNEDSARIREEDSKIEQEISDLGLTGIDKEILAKTRINQGAFRKRLLKRFSNCCLCGVSSRDLLIASHIKPWSRSSPEERVDVNNGFLFCPNHDRLFDKGYISFDANGTIMISKKLSDTDKVFMNVNENMRIDVTEGNKRYLSYHRNIFE